MSQKRDEYINSHYLYGDANRSKEFCFDSNCVYYYGEIDECMYGEPEIPSDWDKECEQKGETI